MINKKNKKIDNALNRKLQKITNICILTKQWLFEKNINIANNSEYKYILILNEKNYLNK